MQPPAARGRGRGRSVPQPVLDGDGGARYERISLLAVELQQGATGGDGADSALLSSDDEASPGRDEERYEFDDDEESEGEERTRKTPQSAKPPRTSKSADMMASAAFGSSSQLFGDTSDDGDSVMSRTSSKRKRDTFKQTFPVKGLKCVGCALANRIIPVERFVNANVGRMAETALWKLAALTWKLEVVDHAKKEGVDVVMWPWRDIANHFKLHTTNAVVGRTSMIQSLTAMRCQVESRLVRVENGERELDKVNAEIMLKILGAESRERSLLAASALGGRGRGGSQKPVGEE